MAVSAGTIDGRVLVAIGDATPTEVATFSADLTVTRHLAVHGATLERDTRKWRRNVAIAFLRIAWHTWTSRSSESRA